MCQRNNILKNTGDHEMVVFKLVLPNGSSRWLTPFMRRPLEEGVQYDGGNRDIKYTKTKNRISKGYFHCYETYLDALNGRSQARYIGALCLRVKCIVPPHTAYYEGTYEFTNDKTLAVRSIIIDKVVFSNEEAER